MCDFKRLQDDPTPEGESGTPEDGDIILQFCEVYPKKSPTLTFIVQMFNLNI